MGAATSAAAPHPDDLVAETVAAAAAVLRSSATAAAGAAAAGPGRSAGRSAVAVPAGPCHLLLASLNAYLIPAPFVNSDNATCRNQRTRAAAIGAALRQLQPDVVCVQEMWGAGMGAVEAAATSPVQGGRGDAEGLRSALRVPSRYQSLWGVDALDVAAQFAAARGGQWLAFREAAPGPAPNSTNGEPGSVRGTSTPPFEADPVAAAPEVGPAGDGGWALPATLSGPPRRAAALALAARLAGLRRGALPAHSLRFEAELSHRYSFSNTRSRKGATLTRFSVHRWEPSAAGGSASGVRAGSPSGAGSGAPRGPGDFSVVVLHTHLDPTNENAAIERQFAEAVALIRRAVVDDPHAFMGTDAPTAGDGAGHRVCNAVLLLVGDFNVDFGSPLCQKLLRQHFGADPLGPAGGATTDLAAGVGATYDHKTNGLAWPQSPMRLDWLLAVNRLPLRPASDGGPGAAAGAPPPAGPSCLFRRAVPVAAAALRTPLGAELSDHWPLLAAVRVEPPEATGTPVRAAVGFPAAEPVHHPVGEAMKASSPRASVLSSHTENNPDPHK